MLNRFISVLRKAGRYRQESRDLSLLQSSRMFDENWYVAQNADVARARMDPILHYLRNGGFEGRDPGPGFSSRWYLNANDDVKKAGMNPLVHYLRYGKQEGREIRPAGQMASEELRNVAISKTSLYFDDGAERFFRIYMQRTGTRR